MVAVFFYVNGRTSMRYHGLHSLSFPPRSSSPPQMVEPLFLGAPVSPIQDLIDGTSPHFWAGKGFFTTRESVHIFSMQAFGVKYAA